MSELHRSGEFTMHKAIMRMFFCLISLLVILVLPLHASGISKHELRTFTASAGGVRLNGLLKESEIVDGKVTVKVPSYIFDGPLKINDVRKVGRFGLREVDMLIAYRRLIIEGNFKKVIELWEPNERKRISRLFMDKENSKKSRSYFKEHLGVTIVGMIFQKNTTSVLIDSGGGITSQTFVNKAGELYFTNHPTDDLELAIVEASLSKEGGVYLLEQTTAGQVISYSSCRKGEKLQLLKNPVFYTRREGNKTVSMPSRPKNPIWQDVPDGTYKTNIMGITFIVKDSQILQATGRDGRTITR